MDIKVDEVRNSSNMAVNNDKKRFSLFPWVKKSDVRPRSLSLDPSYALKHGDNVKSPAQTESIDETLKQFKIDGFEAFSMSTTKFGKIFWLLMILTASAVLIYEMYKTIDNYMNSPIVTTYTIRPTSAMEFPQIYVCSTNFIMQSKLNEENVKFARFYKTSVSANINPGECSQKSNIDQSDKNFTKIFHEQMMNVSYDPNNFFFYCMFRETSFVPLSCPDIGEPILDPTYGKCYLFSITNHTQLISAQGFMMFINVGTEDYPTEKCLAPDSIGAMISIGNPFNPADNQMIYVPPATYARLDMRAQHLNFLNVDKDGQRCRNDGSYTFSVLNVSYSQSACQRDCFLQTVLKTCNCIPILDPRYIKKGIMDGTQFCTIEQTRQCIVLNVSNSKEATGTINNCSDLCYTSCDIWRYPTRLSSMPMSQSVWTPRGLDVKDMIIVMVSFTNMEIEVFEQQLSKTPDDLVADIGGQINLWLGASMMTLLQMPILMITLCGYSAYSLARKGTRNNKWQS